MSSVRTALRQYLAGHLSAEALAAVVAGAYYDESADRGQRDALRPVIDVIERAAPGSVELVRGNGAAGFALRPAGRPFPPAFESELRDAAQRAVGTLPVEVRAGMWARFVGALRRAFTSPA